MADKLTVEKEKKKILKPPKQKDKDGLPVVQNEDLDDYIDFYERLIKKRLKIDVVKLREKTVKKIAQKLTKKKGQK